MGGSAEIWKFPFLFFNPSLNTNVFLSGIHDNPDIVLCPFPSYNFANLKSIGYDNAAWHAMGRIKDKSYLGWTGNTTNNETSANQIIQNISILQGRFSK